MASNYSSNSESGRGSPEPGTSGGFVNEQEQQRPGDQEKLAHAILWDPDLLLYMDSREDITSYAIAHDPAQGNHKAHYHFLFGYPAHKQLGKIIRDARKEFGCKGESLSAKTCRRKESGEYCGQCQFLFKKTKAIQSWVHARNCFQYIQDKEGSITHTDTDLSIIEAEEEYQASAGDWEDQDGSDYSD